MTTSKNPNNNHLKVFLHFFRKYKWRVPLLILTQLFMSLLEGVGIIALFPLITIVLEKPEASGSIFYAFFQNIAESFSLSMTLPTVLCMISGLFIGKAILRYIAAFFIADLSSRVVLDIRLKLFEGIVKARWPFYIRTPIGVFVNSLFTEAQRAGGTFLCIMDLTANMFQILVLISLAFIASWKIVTASMVIGFLLWFLLAPILRSSRLIGAAQKDLSKTINSRISDILNNLKPVKAMGVEQTILKKVKNDIYGLFQAAKKQIILKQSLVIFAEPFVVVFISLGLFLALNVLELDMASAFVMAALFYKIMSSWNVLQQRYQTLNFQESFFWSVTEFTEDVYKNEENTQASENKTLDKSIVFEDVHFSYEDKAVLSGANFQIPANQITALTGPSGSGKTTVVDLICKLYSPSSGKILIDGVDLNQIDMTFWRHQIGYVSQEFVVFHDTLLENLTLGRPCSEDDVISALKAAGAWDFVQGLPEGIHSVLGEKGQKLSGGQRQRISIARALIDNPRLLIMDEATASLDPKTEEAILETLEKLKHKTTILIISHGQQVEKYADLCIDLEQKS